MQKRMICNMKNKKHQHPKIEKLAPEEFANYLIGNFNEEDPEIKQSIE
uniref:Uncharacterized protein n=1 Tax=Rhizophora mucronata TaxID=61149 RepID=A0A2P2MUP1_RHIMU